MEQDAFPLKKLCLEINSDLERALDVIYNHIGLGLTLVSIDKEGAKYSACVFNLGRARVLFRAAHETPTKRGQFVTLWKRKIGNSIEPYDAQDPVDLFVVSVRKGDSWGQFVFTKDVLIQQGVVSTSIKAGKRAFRVYPAWDLVDNKQAEKAKKWQQLYFLDCSKNIDDALCRALYSVSF